MIVLQMGSAPSNYIRCASMGKWRIIYIIIYYWKSIMTYEGLKGGVKWQKARPSKRRHRWGNFCCTCEYSILMSGRPTHVWLGLRTQQSKDTDIKVVLVEIKVNLSVVTHIWYDVYRVSMVGRNPMHAMQLLPIGANNVNCWDPSKCQTAGTITSNTHMIFFHGFSDPNLCPLIEHPQIQLRTAAVAFVHQTVPLKMKE